MRKFANIPALNDARARSVQDSNWRWFTKDSIVETDLRDATHLYVVLPTIMAQFLQILMRHLQQLVILRQIVVQ